MKVPYLDLRAQYRRYRGEIDRAVRQVLESGTFVSGPRVEQFERDFASYCRCRYAVAASSGTDALRLAFSALGIGPGDEVITAPNTFIATVEAISGCGARPVFVDIEPDTCTLDPQRLPEAITRKTRAIVPVHLFGQTADMDAIAEIGARHGLFVIEDACQAHGAEYKGRRAGSMGDLACFSFYPGKNLGACGEAGAVVTDSQELARKMKMQRNHGQERKHQHLLIGWNARMDELQAAVLSVKLKHLDAWNEARRQLARLYSERLRTVQGVVLPVEREHSRHIYHVYAIRTRQRSALIDFLQGKGIGCGIHYPLPVHLQEAYRWLKLPRGSYPVAERCADELISLPIFAELTVDQALYVCEMIEKHLSRAAAPGKGNGC